MVHGDWHTGTLSYDLVHVPSTWFDAPRFPVCHIPVALTYFVLRGWNKVTVSLLSMKTMPLSRSLWTSWSCFIAASVRRRCQPRRGTCIVGNVRVTPPPVLFFSECREWKMPTDIEVPLMLQAYGAHSSRPQGPWRYTCKNPRQYIGEHTSLPQRIILRSFTAITPSHRGGR